MTDGEKATIKAFALGDKSLRDDAISIYRDNLRKYGISPQDPFFNFMSEMDNPCPDLNLRARYRGAIIRSDLSHHVGRTP